MLATGASLVMVAACAADCRADTSPSTQPAVEFQSLIDRGDYAAALARVDAMLAERPGDERLTRARTLLAQRVAGAASRPAVASTRAWSLDDRLALDTSSAILAELARASADPAGKPRVEKLARELLDQTADLAKHHPESADVWLRRAAAALALNRAEEGTEAAERLRAVGALSSEDPATRALIVRLNRIGWMKEGAHAMAAAQAELPRAIEKGDLAEVERLLKAGASATKDIAMKAMPTKINDGGWIIDMNEVPTGAPIVPTGAPMTYAASFGNVPVMDALHRAGAPASVNSTSQQEVALRVALRAGHANAARWLVKNGADIRAATMGMALMQPPPEISQLLAEHGIQK